jgi:hypothetical protein
MRLRLTLEGYQLQLSSMTLSDVAARIRDGDLPPNADFRQALADRIEGKTKGKRGPKKGIANRSVRLQAYACYSWLIYIEKLGIDAAKMQVAEWFNVSGRTVHDWVSDLSGLSLADLMCATPFMYWMNPAFGDLSNEQLESIKPEKVKQFRR